MAISRTTHAPVPDAGPASLQERAALLRREQPAAAAAVEQHVDALERSGLSHEQALRRGLEAVGR